MTIWNCTQSTCIGAQLAQNNVLLCPEILCYHVSNEILSNAERLVDTGRFSLTEYKPTLRLYGRFCSAITGVKTMATDKTTTAIADTPKKKMKPRGGNSPVIGDNGDMTEPGDNAKYIEFGMALAALPEIDLHDIGQLQERINEFFLICKAADMKPAVSGLALALNLDRRRLWEIKTESASNAVKVNKMPPACVDVIKKTYVLMELNWENMMQDGKINPAAGVLIGVNNYGYQDVKQFNVSQAVPHDPLGDLTDPEELRRRYMSAIPEECD